MDAELQTGMAASHALRAKTPVKRYVHDALFIVPAFWREKNYRVDKAKPAKQDS